MTSERQYILQMTPATLDSVLREQFFLIAGPCVVETEELCFTVADRLRELEKKYHLPVIFKASYKKANRLSGTTFTGIGMREGLAVLQKIKKVFGFSILTDIHDLSEINDAAAVADVLQIPAFLSRQTDLLRAAADTGKWVNIKKGQFLAPEDMASIAAKTDSKRLLLTERGVSFGYRNLVVDFRALPIMAQTGFPVVFDATHSLQKPGAAGGASTGQPEYILPMARAAVAVGVHGLFVETHPDPASALSDAGAMLPLDQLENLIVQVLAIRETMNRVDR